MVVAGFAIVVATLGVKAAGVRNSARADGQAGNQHSGGQPYQIFPRHRAESQVCRGQPIRTAQNDSVSTKNIPSRSRLRTCPCITRPQPNRGGP